MKRVIIVFLSIFLLTGCSSIKNLSYEGIINDYILKENNLANEYRAGYTYFLPKGLRQIKTNGSNEIFASDNIYYYLYVDKVSYYNKVQKDFVENSSAIFSEKITNNNKYGYLEIKNTKEDEYFIEIMYNYAKIEVIVPKNREKDAIACAMSVLSSINYQDTVLKNMMEESTINQSEVEYNIFETAKTESGYLEIYNEYGQYQENEDNVDPDFIRR